MIIGYKKGFEKRTRRLSFDIKRAFAMRLQIFVKDPHHPLLNDHRLTVDWNGYRSINVTGDWRAVYQPVDANTIIFVDIDTHHNLYGT